MLRLIVFFSSALLLFSCVSNNKDHNENMLRNQPGEVIRAYDKLVELLGSEETFRLNMVGSETTFHDSMDSDSFYVKRVADPLLVRFEYFLEKESVIYLSEFKIESDTIEVMRHLQQEFDYQTAVP